MTFQVCLRDGKQTLALLTAAQQHWTFTHVFQNPSVEVAATMAAQTELHKEVAGLGTTLADGHNVLLMAVGASRSGKTLTLLGEPDSSAAAGTCGFYVPEATSEDGGEAATKATAVPAATTNQARSTKKGKGKGGRGGMQELGDGGGGVAVEATPLAGILPRLLAETFATLDHRVAQCAFVVSVSAAAVSIPAAPDTVGSRGGVVESLLSPAIPPPPVRSGSSPPGDGEQVEGDGGDGDGGGNEKKREERDRDLPLRSPPDDDGMWGGKVAASSPQEVMELIADARSRAASPSDTSAAGGTTGMREDRHFLSRVRVDLVNRSTSEASSCEMVMVELVEEKPGEAWPAALADVVRAHAAATAVSNKGDEADGILGMVRGCLSDTAKVRVVTSCPVRRRPTVVALDLLIRRRRQIYVDPRSYYSNLPRWMRHLRCQNAMRLATTRWPPARLRKPKYKKIARLSQFHGSCSVLSFLLHPGGNSFVRESG